MSELHDRAPRVLFFMRNFRGYFRVFEPALRVMGARGFAVHLAYDDKGTPAERMWAEALTREFPTITSGPTPDRRGTRWHQFSRNVRLAADYLRFLRPEFATAPDLRSRAAKRAPKSIVFLAKLPGFGSPRAVAAMIAVLTRVERCIPSHPLIEEFIKGFDPDVVLLTPLLSIGSRQPDYLKSAQALGVPTMACVASWDNLSSKSLIRFLPDIVTVWNETQRREAIELHGVPKERVVITGAQNFDPWFGWSASPREEFVARAGLPSDRPFIFFAGSSLFAASITEPEFVRRWLQTLRAGPDARLRDAAVLIRPHPKRGEEWKAADLGGFGHVVIWPRAGMMPVGTRAKTDYYDSMYHSAAVVGLNTSALIEAGIVGRTVHTLVNNEFAGSQDGTLHFRYLVDGGLLRAASSMEEHAAQLSEALAGVAWGVAARRRFLEAFVRPFGLDVAASPLFADAVKKLATQPRPHPVSGSDADLLLRWLLTPLAIRGQLAHKGGRGLRRAGKIAGGGDVRAIARECVKMARQRQHRERKHKEKKRALKGGEVRE